MVSHLAILALDETSASYVMRSRKVYQRILTVDDVDDFRL